MSHGKLFAVVSPALTWQLWPQKHRSSCLRSSTRAMKSSTMPDVLSMPVRDLVNVVMVVIARRVEELAGARKAFHDL